MRWLLNNAVIPAGAFGRYSYAPLRVADIRPWLVERPFTSRIGCRETAYFTQRLTGITIPISWEAMALEPGDEALVVRLRYRLADAALKRQALCLADDEWEIGRLTCLERLRPGEPV